MERVHPSGIIVAFYHAVRHVRFIAAVYGCDVVLKYCRFRLLENLARLLRRDKRWSAVLYVDPHG